jgi:hypothetical protein
MGRAECETAVQFSRGRRDAVALPIAVETWPLESVDRRETDGRSFGTEQLAPILDTATAKLSKFAATGLVIFPVYLKIADRSRAHRRWRDLLRDPEQIVAGTQSRPVATR